MNAAFQDRFDAQLRVYVIFLGRPCQLRPSTGGIVDVATDDLIDTETVGQAQDAFESRKWMTTTIGNTPLSLSETNIPTTSKHAIADFLQYFVQQPIGPRLLTFDRGHDFRSYRDREAAINQAYLNWFAIRYAARRSDGRLKHAIPCPGYFKDQRSMCQKSVLDSSGCCASHRGPTAKTLFTFYPWFEREGFPEFSCGSEFPKAAQTRQQTESERQQRSHNAANRTRKREEPRGHHTFVSRIKQSSILF